MDLLFLRPLAPYILSILRILSSLTFLTHGTRKYFDWPEPQANPLNAMTATAGVLEIVGGLMLAVGLFSRPVAFILSGLMAVAYFYSHAGRSFFPLLNGGEPALLFCWVFLLIAASGPGPISIDAKIGKD